MIWKESLKALQRLALRYRTITWKPTLSRILLKTPWEHCSVIELFDHYLGLDLKDVLLAQQLKEIAIAGGYGALVEEIPDHYEKVFFRLWDHFESQLGQEAPLLVYDWPLPLASLAQGREDKPGVSERMELYIAGMEIGRMVLEN